jgi:hypothetical protein
MRAIITVGVAVLLTGHAFAQGTDCTPQRAAWTVTAESGHAPEDNAQNTAGPGELFIPKIVTATTDGGGPLLIYFEGKSHGQSPQRSVALLARCAVNNCAWVSPSGRFPIEAGERIAVVGSGTLTLDVVGWRVPASCRAKWLGLD